MIDMLLRIFFGKYFESYDNNFITMNMNAGVEIRNIIIKNDEINNFLKSKNVDIEIVYLKIEKINISFLTLSGVLTLKLQGVDLRIKPNIHKNASKGIKNKLMKLLKNKEKVHVIDKIKLFSPNGAMDFSSPRRRLQKKILCCSCENYKDIKNTLCSYNNYSNIKTYICKDCSILKNKKYGQNFNLLHEQVILKKMFQNYTTDINNTPYNNNEIKFMHENARTILNNKNIYRDTANGNGISINSHKQNKSNYSDIKNRHDFVKEDYSKIYDNDRQKYAYNKFKDQNYYINNDDMYNHTHMDNNNIFRYEEELDKGQNSNFEKNYLTNEHVISDNNFERKQNIECKKTKTKNDQGIKICNKFQNSHKIKEEAYKNIDYNILGKQQGHNYTRHTNKLLYCYSNMYNDDYRKIKIDNFFQP
ncbi:conserved Plasmodium protein, unknown function [Plasmodium vinckei brucechwatti]|uniref:Chorein N-terminal domain-containing protein n=1 Tax=Plasmodium vinckei brucechwatti TaxID=119398 RepID=A0A6V7S1I2_PLAVN|nr:conserved Plasmodium protein, unknown function [Plasmodium vinckei brucechwatti]